MIMNGFMLCIVMHACNFMSMNKPCEKVVCALTRKADSNFGVTCHVTYC